MKDESRTMTKEQLAKLEQVQAHMPTMKREDLEQALLSYSAFFLNVTQSLNLLLAGMPDESDTTIWGPTL
jgi:hypothetical protein